MTTVLICTLLVLVAGFALVNGFLDGGGLVSTVVATRSLSAGAALLVVVAGEVLGPLVLGRAVFETMGTQLFVWQPEHASLVLLKTLFGAFVGAAAWNLLMWRWGLPSSSSHSLLGAMTGSVWVIMGSHSIRWLTLIEVSLALIFVPLAAGFVSWMLAKSVAWGGQWISPRQGRVVKMAQVVFLFFLAIGHSSNDGQKAAAIAVMSLSAAGLVLPFSETVLFLLAGCLLALGVVLGSARTLKTMGRRFYRIQPWQSVSAQGSTMIGMAWGSLAGWPLSTSHVLSSSVLGAGVARTAKGVRWGPVGEMGMSWLATLPASALLAAGVAYVVSKTI